MSGDAKILPSVMWAQRPDKLFVTINVEDCKEPKINIQDNKITFKGKGGPDKKEYEIEIEFYGDLNPSESKYAILARNIPMMLKKKEEGPYWPRLLKEKTKQHWLKTDFDKWKDEDDSDAEAGDDMQLEDMMAKMGNFNPQEDLGDLGGPGEEEDSDDEELPDLE